MLFLMPASDFSQKVIAAIKAGASYRVIPWQMGIVAIFLRALPNFLSDRHFRCTTAQTTYEREVGALNMAQLRPPS